MNLVQPRIVQRLLRVSLSLGLLLGFSLLAGLLWGSSQADWRLCLQTLAGFGPADDILPSILWQIRFPRVVLAALVGGTLSLGGLVFQALLHNPLAEPYIRSEACWNEIRSTLPWLEAAMSKALSSSALP